MGGRRVRWVTLLRPTLEQPLSNVTTTHISSCPITNAIITRSSLEIFEVYLIPHKLGRDRNVTVFILLQEPAPGLIYHIPSIPVGVLDRQPTKGSTRSR
jgi:hypothetical protein